MGQALIHGLENPSLVICPAGPEALGESLTSLTHPGLGTLKGPILRVCETPGQS